MNPFDDTQPAFATTQFRMVLASNDSEAQAIEIALRAFRDLTPEQTRRVLNYVHDRVTDELP